jgi:spoIIIJ-associated protein
MAKDVGGKALDLVLGITAAMGLKVEGSVEDSEDALRIELRGEAGEALLRRRGEALDALQHIANTAFRKSLGENKRLVVDALGYRRGKDDELRQMAKFLAGKAKTSGVPQEIGPLNPYARRIVHITFAEDPEVTSESAGDAFMKTVVISRRS